MTQKVQDRTILALVTTPLATILELQSADFQTISDLLERREEVLELLCDDYQGLLGLRRDLAEHNIHFPIN